jgi:endonuclease/exonuclease/phosphatase (EEP) superfamily protein YafD
MKKRLRPKIPVVTILYGLLFGIWAGIIAGCMSIPDQAIIIIGSQDQILGQEARTCTSAGVSRAQTHYGYGIDPDGFSVLSWNSHKGSQPGWEEDFAIRGQAADFVLLQEAALDAELKALLSSFASDWLLAVAFQLGEDDIGILSAGRVPAHFYCALREPEPLIRIPKVILASTYPFSGTDRELLIINVHLVNFTFGSEAVQKQAEALKAIVEHHNGPVIIAGDFNTWSEERQSLIREKMSEIGLAAVEFDPDNRAEFFNNVVDGLYFRGLIVEKAVSHSVETSDHNPLEVHFSLPKQGDTR